VGFSPIVNDRVASLLSEARNAYALGATLIPVPFKSKKPVIENWSKRGYSLDQIESHIDNNSGETNLGILLGEASNGIIDIDLDCPEAIALAPNFLLETRTFGRQSKPKSHYLYRVVYELPNTKKYEHDGMMLELRSTRCQTLYPASMNPSGEIVEWDGSGDETIRKITADELIELTDELAARALLVRSWNKITRHNASLPLAGWLMRAWEDEYRVKDFIARIARVAGDDEIEDRMTCVDTTIERLESGQTATGFPVLAGIIGDDAARKVADWLRIPIEKTNPNVFDAESLPVEERCTDRGNAEGFIAFADGDLRYVSERKSWAMWDKSHWEIGNHANGFVKTLAIDYAKSIFDEAKGA
jgi:hypothetical protein